MFTMNFEEYSWMSELGYGICLKCGEVQEGCEPDAEGYTCEACGADAVMGLEQAFMCIELEVVG